MGTEVEHGTRYSINGHIVGPDDPRFQDLLANCYNGSTRPRCLCAPGGVDMYVARFKSFVVKRMPGTGEQHHPTCPSYEPASGESGLGELLGEAIFERTPELIEVRLDFPLTRRLGRPFSPGAPSEKTEVSAARRKLGLRGLLHLLWERAGFNRWYPKMEGKRYWGVVRKHLMAAAQEIQTKGARLDERVFIPEPFRLENATAIARRRAADLSVLLSPSEDVQFKMMVIIGELKEFSDTALGSKIILKHMSDCPLYLDTKTAVRFRKVFCYEYETWLQEKDLSQEKLPRFRFILGGLIYAKRENLYYLDTATLMMTGENWIPLDYTYEQTLMSVMQEQRRRFIKPLRYESKGGAVFPNFVLLDAGDAPVSLDIVSAFMADKDRAVKESVVRERIQPAWVWKTADTPEPPGLPAARFVDYPKL